MPESELAAEIAAGIAFSGWEDGDGLQGVMGVQPVRDVILIRHAYVRPNARERESAPRSSKPSAATSTAPS